MEAEGGESDLTTVDMSVVTESLAPEELPGISNLSTVDNSIVTTVDTFHLSTVDTLETSDASTSEGQEISPETPARSTIFWVTESGDLVPSRRVRPIRAIQDVVSEAEEAVYNALWTATSVPDGDGEPFRLVQAGYDYIGKGTRLSKKTVQRIIAKLMDKGFIAIERPADIYQRTSTVYRVFSRRQVLEHHLQKGRSHVAKFGPGFSYVHPLGD